MKKEAGANQYTIEINKKIYGFSCDDGEEHVEIMKRKLQQVFSRISQHGSEQILSNHALKMALLLADEAARDERKCNEQEEILTRRLTPLLAELDRVLKPKI